MATVKFFLGIVCLALAGSNSLPGGDSINLRQDPALTDRKRLLQVAEKELGVRESSGNNDGPRVAEYLSYVHVPEGSAWCAAFVSWVFGQAGYPVPRTAWSPALFPLSKRTKQIRPAVVFGIYFSQFRRIAHCGLVERQDGDWMITIEGNTNPDGSREGDGVYRKRRPLKAVKYFADWITKKGGADEN
ncbi:peptidoglycan-binding protein [Pedobacter suwonensis]|uniref:peptidoglycan-binding protein n=1 Tax=Pedobacter suwonensis TaxID=332999 RepID=UPI0025F3EE95|nr:peptidoglycan-binding protein [uncultured Pedobacter sp.]